MNNTLKTGNSDSLDKLLNSDWHDDLMLTKRPVTLELEPFPHFYIDDFLPKPLFEAARREFPANTTRDQYGNMKQVFSQHRHPDQVEEFLRQCRPWRELTDFFESDVFMQDLRQFLRPALKHARGISGLRRWRRRDRETILPIVDMPITSGYEFTLLGEGAHLLPHTDSPSKVAVLLLYLPPDDWKPEYGGATEAYRPKNARQDRNWMNRNLRFEDVELVYRSEFRPNRLFGFVKSANSFHGVSPVTCGPDRMRNNFIYNVLIDQVAEKSPVTRYLNEWRRRREAPAFAEVEAITKPQ